MLRITYFEIARKLDDFEALFQNYLEHKISSNSKISHHLTNHFKMFNAPIFEIMSKQTEKFVKFGVLTDVVQFVVNAIIL